MNLKKVGIVSLTIYCFILSLYYWLTGYNDLASAYLIAFAGWILIKYE